MIVSITKIELNSYSRLIYFLKFNRQIINELKQSECISFKATGNWNLKVWYTMTLWKNEIEIDTFYRSGKHLEVMKLSKKFSSKIQSKRVNEVDLISWKKGKKLFENN